MPLGDQNNNIASLLGDISAFRELDDDTLEPETFYGYYFDLFLRRFGYLAQSNAG